MANFSGGSVVWNLDIDNSKFNSKLASASGAINQAANKGSKTTDSFSKSATTALTTLGKAGWMALATTVAGAMFFIGKHISSAVKRIDTLVNFPKVLESMGASSDDAQKSAKSLSDNLKGLPTSLQDGASGVQQLVAAGLSVPKATDAFLAMNNALIAGGANAADTQIVMDSFIRSLAAGKIDTSTFTAMMSRMPTAMQGLQKATGKSRVELEKLYTQNPKQLIADLIKLNKKGGGNLASLDKQARDMTGGIATSWKNMGNSIDRGWQKIVTAIGGGNLEAGSKKISDVINTMGKSFIGFVNFVIANKDFIIPVVAAITSFVAALVIAGMAMTAFNFIAEANPFVRIIAAIIAIIAVLAYLQARFNIFGVAIKAIVDFVTALWDGAWNAVKTGLDAVGNFFKSVWDGIKRVISGMIDWIKNNWAKILVILTGPIGLAVALIIKNFDKIKSAVSGVWNFIKNTFNKISSIPSQLINSFHNIGSGLANSIKEALNSLLHLPLTVPKVSVAGKSVGGQTLIPRLAEGGIIPATSGGRLALVGEGGEDEAVIPLSKLRDMNIGSSGGGNIQVTVNMQGIMARSRTDLRDIAVDLIESVNEGLRAKNLPQLGGGKIMEVSTNG